MNLHHLRYVVEVDNTHSITQAAKNLYMGQPNLSKAIHELEAEIGISIFCRTCRGVYSTKEGSEFLRYARTILSQMDTLQALYTPQPTAALSFSVSAFRATYISVAFSKLVNQLQREAAYHIKFRETNSVDAIQDVINNSSDIAVARYQNDHEPNYLNLLQKNNLTYELLWEYPMYIMMDKAHPLSQYEEIPYHMLADYTEILHGDFQVPDLPVSRHKMGSSSPAAKQIYFYDRGSQFDMLKWVKGTFLWASPLPWEELDNHDLVQRRCSDAERYKDILVYHSNTPLKKHEMRFIEAMKKATDTVLP